MKSTLLTERLNLSDNIPFEDYIMIRSSQIGSGISIVGFLSNLLLGLPLAITLATFLGSIIYWLSALLIKKKYHKEKLFVIIPVFTVIYLNVLWLFNYRSNGPILYLLVVCYLFVYLISWKSNVWIVVVIAFLNLIILFLFDFFLPSSGAQYTSRLVKLTDNYIVAFSTIVLLLVITGIFKRYYTLKLLQAQESDKLKSAFLTNLSHEIRTPLNAIIGFSSLLTNEYSTQEKAEFCQMIQDNGNQLCSLIDRLIVISKLESNSIKLVNEEINIKDLCGKLYEEYASRYEQKMIGFDYRLRGCQTIRTDSRMLSLILSELLSNSLKFSRMGRTRFGAVCCPDRCIFFVKDYGIGVRDENQKQIFDSFVKITETSSGLVGGIGIGLSIVKKAVQQLGGEIKMKSTYQKGSIFFFILPADNN